MTEERKSRYELFLEEEEAPKTKRCARCKETKALDEFGKDKRRKDHLTCACKQCLRRARKRKYLNKDDRFWKEFRESVTPAGDCLEWKRRCNSNGCPIRRWDGKANASVRRIVYKLALGEVPDDMFVATTCNNSRCVRQSHLKLITKEELTVKAHGMQPTGDNHPARARPEYLKRGDKHWAKRHPEWIPRGDKHWSKKRPEYICRGEQSGHAKLTEKRVLWAREVYKEGMSISAIARILEVDRHTLRSAIQGKTWSHVQ